MPPHGSNEPTDPTARYAAWCRRIAASDVTAYEALFRALHPSLHRYAVGLTRDEASAADLVQEAFVRIWERRSTLDPERSVRALLYRSVRNLAFNAQRDRQLHDEKHEELGTRVASPPPPDAVTEGARFEEKLRAWIDALPPRQHEALVLSRYQGLSHDEIAEAMDVSPRTVNNHLVAALRTLRQHVHAYDATLLAR